MFFREFENVFANASYDTILFLSIQEMYEKQVAFLSKIYRIRSMQNLFIEHGFELSQEELEQFSLFLTLFREYNGHTNLSAIRDDEGIILKHFVDSLYGAAFLQEVGDMDGKKLLDI